jgi:hypothetical protein
MTTTKTHSDLTDVSAMTRDDVVPYYADLLIAEADHDEILRVNKLILSKWSGAGLIYIKEKAWKIYNLILEDF